FLGLSHTRVPGATMLAGYSKGDTSMRTLAEDDIDAICAAYPPSRALASTECGPVGGLSGQCGGAQPEPARPLPEPSCAVAGARAGNPLLSGFVLATSLLCLGLR